MQATTMTAFEFVASSRKRKESWSTIILVAGVKLLVICYDLFKKGIHEVYVINREKKTGESVLHIPEIYVQRETDKIQELFGKIIEDISLV